MPGVLFFGAWLAAVCGTTWALYWNMNFHIEHHLHPGVPFHALPQLQRLIADQLPIPCRGPVAANLEILRTIQQQTCDLTCSSRPRFSIE